MGPMARLPRVPRRRLSINELQVQYISDDQGNLTGVILPIEQWREIASELETSHLLKSETMKQRLLEAKSRETGIPFEEALEKLGI